MRKKYFVKLISERDKLMQEHFGECYAEMINFPEERKWYADNIKKYDNKIIGLANQILKEASRQIIKTINDVYKNEFLINMYHDLKKGKKVNE